jgi:hypothetical protein
MWNLKNVNKVSISNKKRGGSWGMNHPGIEESVKG